MFFKPAFFYLVNIRLWQSFWFFFVSGLFTNVVIAGAYGQERLTVDLDSHLVAIETDFIGKDVLLFGTISKGGDIIVIVHGPKEIVTVRKKEQVAGIWVNKHAREFEQVPAFYHIATTHPENAGLRKTALRRHQIGVENIRVKMTDNAATGQAKEQAKKFRDAIIQTRINNGHYTLVPRLVERRGEHMFRTTVHFPANVPVGTYTVETLLVQNGQITSAQTTPLFISKVGLEARIYEFAHNTPMIYGITAIIIAVLFGVMGNWIFRKF